MWRLLLIGCLACAPTACPDTPEPASTPGSEFSEVDPSASSEEAPAPSWMERSQVCTDPHTNTTRCRDLLSEVAAERSEEVLAIRIRHCLRNPRGAVCRDSADAMEHTCLEMDDADACLAIAWMLRDREATRECAARFHRHACRERARRRLGDCNDWEEVDIPLIRGGDDEECAAPVLDEVLVESPRSLDEAIEAIEHVTPDALSTFWLAGFIPRGALLSDDASHAVLSLEGNEATSRAIAFVDRRRAEELPIFDGREFHALSGATDIAAHLDDLRARLSAIRGRLHPQYRMMERIEGEHGASAFEVRVRDVSPSVVEASIHQRRDGRRLWRHRARFRADEECRSDPAAKAWWDPTTRALLVLVSRPSPDACDEREILLATLPL